MSTILLLSIIGGLLIQSVAKKIFNQKSDGRGAYLFTAVSVLAAAAFFVVAGEKPYHFQWAWVPYSLGFAVSYGMASIGTFLAIQYGSMSLTSLATSYSLIIPTLYGLLFLNEQGGFFLYLGLVLLMISLVLINTKKGDMAISFKWAVFALIAFLGNGICSTVQKMQQIAFDGAAKNEFMIVALLVVAAFLFLISLKGERQSWKPCLEKGLLWMVICGVTNGAVNLFVMILSGKMATSVMFPLISAGGILLTTFVGTLAFREKLTLKQYIGVFLGAGAVVFLNL